MVIRTPRDLGAVIREQRRRRALDQQELAAKVGVSRQWLIEVEKGKPRAEVGLILKTLNALGIELNLGPPKEDQLSVDEFGPNIDQIVERARGERE